MPYNENDEWEPPDPMQLAKDATLELERVTIRGTRYTECKKHGLRVNSEPFCSACDYMAEPNCPECGELKDSPFSGVHDGNRYEERDLHKDCRKSGESFWMEPKQEGV